MNPKINVTRLQALRRAVGLLRGTNELPNPDYDPATMDKIAAEKLEGIIKALEG